MTVTKTGSDILKEAVDQLELDRSNDHDVLLDLVNKLLLYAISQADSENAINWFADYCGGDSLECSPAYINSYRLKLKQQPKPKPDATASESVSELQVSMRAIERICDPKLV